MTDTPNTAPTGQESASATPGQEPTTSTTPQAGKSPEDYEKMLADLRKENASHRTKLKTFEEQEAARQLAALSDAEKLQKQYEQAEQRIQKQNKELVNLQVKLAAKDKGIIDPDIAALALDGKLEFGEDGLPSNLEKALDDLIKSKPYLVPKSGEPTPASPAQTASAPNVPAMNPGRSQIVQSGQGTPGRIPSWNEVYKR